MQWFLLHCRVYSIYTIHTQCHINLTVFNVQNNSNHHNNNNPQMVYQLVCLPSSASGLLLPITYWMRPWVSLYLSRSRSLALSLSLSLSLSPTSSNWLWARFPPQSWGWPLYLLVRKWPLRGCRLSLRVSLHTCGEWKERGRTESCYNVMLLCQLLAGLAHSGHRRCYINRNLRNTLMCPYIITRTHAGKSCQARWKQGSALLLSSLCLSCLVSLSVSLTFTDLLQGDRDFSSWLLL